MVEHLWFICLSRHLTAAVACVGFAQQQMQAMSYVDSRVDKAEHKLVFNVVLC